jgi:hypothetical protein
MLNIEENDDTDEEEEYEMDVKENKAKIDINAWRKRRSLANVHNPLFQRRLSQGEKVYELRNSITKQNY